MSMHLGLIKPPALLDAPDVSPYHLVLCSQFRDTCEAHALYRAHYAQRLLDGHTIIVDNDAWETGRGADVTVIQEVVQSIRNYIALPGDEPPEIEVVVPDILNDAKATLELGVRHGQYLRETIPNVRLVVVPQGRTWSEWSDCLAQLVDEVAPDVIGVTRCVFDLPGGVPGGVVIANAWAPTTPIHLFGLSPDPAQYDGISLLPNVRGLDTAKPATLAWAGLRFDSWLATPWLARPEFFFRLRQEMMPEGVDATTLFRYNARALLSWLEGRGGHPHYYQGGCVCHTATTAP